MRSQRLAAFTAASNLIEAIECRGMFADVMDEVLGLPQPLRLLVIWDLLMEVLTRAPRDGRERHEPSVFHGTYVLAAYTTVSAEPWTDDDALIEHDHAFTVATHHFVLTLLAMYCRERRIASLDQPTAAVLPSADDAALQFAWYFCNKPRFCTQCAGHALAFVLQTERCEHALAEFTTRLTAAHGLLQQPCRGGLACSNDAWAAVLWCLARLPRTDRILAAARTLSDLHEHALTVYRAAPRHQSVLDLLEVCTPAAQVLTLPTRRSAS